MPISTAPFTVPKSSMKSSVKAKEHDETVYKVVYSAKKWTMPIRAWKPALNRFAVEFAERFPDEHVALQVGSYDDV